MILYRIFSLLKVLIILLVGVTCPNYAVAAAGLFYVATNGSNSRGDGSDGNPWATISYAIQQVPDNSTIL